MNTYITVMFWLALLRAILLCCGLVSDHPRIVKHNIGSDVLNVLVACGMLAWVSYLKFFA